MVAVVRLTGILERLGATRGPVTVALVGAAAALAIEDDARADRWLGIADAGDARPVERRRRGTRVLGGDRAARAGAGQPPVAGPAGDPRRPGAVTAGVRDHDLLAPVPAGGWPGCPRALRRRRHELRRVAELGSTTGRGGLELAARSQLAAASGGRSACPRCGGGRGRGRARRASRVGTVAGGGPRPACRRLVGAPAGEDAEARRRLVPSAPAAVVPRPQVRLRRGASRPCRPPGPDGHAAAVRDYVDVLRRTAGGASWLRRSLAASRAPGGPPRARPRRADDRAQLVEWPAPGSPVLVSGPRSCHAGDEPVVPTPPGVCWRGGPGRRGCHVSRRSVGAAPRRGARGAARERARAATSTSWLPWMRHHSS